jgi:hypothetical protein
MRAETTGGVHLARNHGSTGSSIREVGAIAPTVSLGSSSAATDFGPLIAVGYWDSHKYDNRSGVYKYIYNYYYYSYIYIEYI